MKILEPPQPTPKLKEYEIFFHLIHGRVLVSLNLIHNLLFKRTLVDFLFQVWNHDFFWESMQPGGGNMPILGLLGQIEKDFGSFTNFKEKFIEAALTLFGSGWVWLVGKSCLRQLLLPSPYYKLTSQCSWLMNQHLSSLN